ncbi:MAG: hypothetical protein Ct9H300mP11_17000 [Chloroflexota bacterium]|nr:MAG: hypothetical protein Ct9H300mP11_17000 [Chloroflexota bacterium]
MFPGGSYCRDLLVAPDDPNTIYLAAGAGGGAAPPGHIQEGALFRSRDVGETWDRLDLGETVPGRMMAISIDQAAPTTYTAPSTLEKSTVAPTAAVVGPRAFFPARAPGTCMFTGWYPASKLGLDVT